MKTHLASLGALVLTGFALCSTGCVTEYHSIAATPAYSGTTLPAASTVAFVMEFRGGDPTPEEREDVRAILTDYFAGKGSAVVAEPSQADYVVYAVLERRNPDNPAEWTVVSTSSARSLNASGGDEFEWPGGIIEDEEFETSSFSYMGFGLFYPIWFDVWDSPWHRGRVILCPPPYRHHRDFGDQWRHDRRWHRPERWHDRRPDGRRPDVERRDPDRDRRDRDRARDGNRGDNNRPNNGDRRDRDHRDNNKGPGNNRPDDNRRGDNHSDPNWKPDAERSREVIRERDRSVDKPRSHETSGPGMRPSDSRRSQPQPSNQPHPPIVAPTAGNRPPVVHPPAQQPPHTPTVRREPPRQPSVPPHPRTVDRPGPHTQPPQPAQRPPSQEVRPAQPQPAATPRLNPPTRPHTEPPARVEPATRSALHGQSPRAAEARQRMIQQKGSNVDGGRRNPPPAREGAKKDSDSSSDQKDNERK
jgi:hypothetical protein